MKRDIFVDIVFAAVGAVLLFAFLGIVAAPAAPAKEIAATAKSGLGTFEERVAAIKGETMEKYGPDIEWLASSIAENEEERQLLREHFATEFDKAEDISRQRIILEVAKVDLNGDGRQDLVWRIFHPFYFGLGTSATLGISYYDENGRLIHVRHFPVTWAPIAVRSGGKSAWKELLVDDRVYRWNGKSYDLIAVPVETLAEGPTPSSSNISPARSAGS